MIQAERGSYDDLRRQHIKNMITAIYGRQGFGPDDIEAITGMFFEQDRNDDHEKNMIRDCVIKYLQRKTGGF